MTGLSRAARRARPRKRPGKNQHCGAGIFLPDPRMFFIPEPMKPSGTFFLLFFGFHIEEKKSEAKKAARLKSALRSRPIFLPDRIFFIPDPI
jgi:hypothetical protein